MSLHLKQERTKEIRPEKRAIMLFFCGQKENYETKIRDSWIFVLAAMAFFFRTGSSRG